MSAPNFCLRNANRYFIIEEPEDADYWFWNDAKEYLTNMARERGFEWLENDEWKNQIERKSDICRDYCAEALPVFIEEEFMDKYLNTWNVTLVPLVRSGYYAHACLDFYIKLNAGHWEDLEDEDAYCVETLKSVIMDYLDYQRDCRGEDVQEGEGTELLNKVDEIIAKVTERFYEWAENCGIDEYVKAWQCSNGEAGYINKTKLAEKALKH